MTVANGTVAEFAEFTTATPISIEFTPAADARGIVCCPVLGGSSTDQVTGVTCEGVAMTRIETGADAAGEAMRVYIYFLAGTFAAGVAQTIEISTTGTASAKWAVVASYTAAAAVEIVTFSKLEGDAANPQIALDTGVTSSLRLAIIGSGLPTVTDLAELAGMETAAATTQNDFGANITKLGRQTTASTGSYTIGWTAASDDVAMAAAAIQEVAVAGGKVHRLALLGVG